MRGRRLSLIAVALLLGSPAGAAPRFVDRAVDLPVSHVYSGGWSHFVGGGVAVFDCDGDHRPDLFAAGGAAPATLLRNTSDPGGAITFIAEPAPEIRAVTGAYPLDLDSDGTLDLMVLRNGANMLLRGLGNCRFEDATERFELTRDTRWSTAFSATWEGANALPTLAVGNYVDATDPDGPFGTCDVNFLLRPATGGDTFAPAIPLKPGFCTLSMLFSDWRRSGDAMLRISNDRHYYVKAGYEQMWTLDPLRELDTADGWDRLSLWGMGIASRDLNADGWPEVMLTSMGDQVLLENDGTGFAIAPFERGSAAHRPFTGGDGRPSTGWHAEFGDVDNDGRADLFIAKGNVDQMPGMATKDPNNLLMQRPDGTFGEAADTAGIASLARSRGAALADLNRDGRLDLVVVNRRAPLEVWQNATPGAGGWLSLDIRQPAPNTRAVGAFVELRAAGRLQTQEITVGGGHVSGSTLPRHFGLGAAQGAQVRVIWPDGSASPWHTLAAGQHMILEKGQPPRPIP